MGNATKKVMEDLIRYLKPSKQKRQKRRDKRLHEELIECYRGGMRSKHGKGYLKNAAANLWENEPYREGIKKRHGWTLKYQCDNLGPLEKYLRSKVGKHWDKVYSDISKKFDRNSAIGLHVYQHMWDYIAKNVEVRGKNVIEYCEWGGPKLLYSTVYRPAFYICPKNKTLKMAKVSTHTEARKFVL